MERLRLWNVSFALTRLIGMLAMAGVFGYFWYLAWWNDHAWHMRAMGLGMAGFFLAWSAYAALTAAWVVDLDDRGVAVRRLLRRRVYAWSEILELRPVDLQVVRATRYLGKYVALEVRRRHLRPLVRVLVRPERLGEIAAAVAGRTGWADDHNLDRPPRPSSVAGRAAWFVLDVMAAGLEAVLRGAASHLLSARRKKSGGRHVR